MSARSLSWPRFGDRELEQGVLVFLCPGRWCCADERCGSVAEEKNECCGHLGACAFEADGKRYADGARGWAESEAERRRMRASMCVCLWKDVGLWHAERCVPPVRSRHAVPMPASSKPRALPSAAGSALFA
jgi:hypothetical protein